MTPVHLFEDNSNANLLIIIFAHHDCNIALDFVHCLEDKDFHLLFFFELATNCC